MHFGHESRAITMLFLNEIIPLANPYHSSPITMSMQCICKIFIITPANFVCGGVYCFHVVHPSVTLWFFPNILKMQ